MLHMFNTYAPFKYYMDGNFCILVENRQVGYTVYLILPYSGVALAEPEVWLNLRLGLANLQTTVICQYTI